MNDMSVAYSPEYVVQVLVRPYAGMVLFMGREIEGSITVVFSSLANVLNIFSVIICHLIF